MKHTLLFILATLSNFAVASPFANDAEKLSTVKYMIHEGTIIAEFDYANVDTLRNFEDYDFTIESAPCSVLGDYYTASDDNNTVYTIKVGDKDFRFMCRAVSGMDNEKRRLYMLGSVYDCMSRPFNFSDSELAEYQYFGSMCEKTNREKFAKIVDYSYLELFHPDKYFKLLAQNTN